MVWNDVNELFVRKSAVDVEREVRDPKEKGEGRVGEARWMSG